MRETESLSRPVVCVPVRYESFVRILFLRLSLESDERLIPELIEPDPNRGEPLRIDVIDAARALCAIDYQSRLFQNPEMLGNRRTAHRHARGDLAHRARPAAQFLEHLPAGRICEGQQCRLVSHN